MGPRTLPKRPPGMGKRLNKAASLPINQQTDPYAGFDNGDDSDEEQKPIPILYVRGKSPTNVEDVLKIQKCKVQIAQEVSDFAALERSTFVLATPHKYDIYGLISRDLTFGSSAIPDGIFSEGLVSTWSKRS